MKRPLWHRIDLLARHLTPFGLTLALVLVGTVPLHIPEYARIFPLLSLMAVYHWTIYRPDLLPAYAVFLIGLLQDVLTAAPLGVTAVVLLAVHGAVLSQRRFFFGKSFVVEWLGFVLMAAGATVLGWVLVSAYNATLIGPDVFLFQYLVTIGLFPPVAWAFLRWQQAFLGQE